ncbi:MAG: hypothetical protein WCK77_14190 [Verrucomicrobiota bacterium]
MLTQLEFDNLLAAIFGSDPAPNGRVTPRAARLVVGNMSAESFTAALTLALASENLAFTTYAIGVAVTMGGGCVSICDLSDTLNLSYHAILHQAERTPYFAWDRTQRRVRVRLSAEGEAKLGRMARRLAGRGKR